jgi:hypothetical protein
VNPPAIGYLRSDVSGISQQWHETQIRSLAKRFGYDLSRIVVFNERTDDPVQRLLNVVTNTEAEAVFAPSEDHFGGPVPLSLVNVCDVVTVDDEHTRSRDLAARLQPPQPVPSEIDQQCERR